MGASIHGKLQHRRVVTSRRGEQQALGILVLHDDDVVLPDPQLDFVGADR
jgi:hypothetical protein